MYVYVLCVFDGVCVCIVQLLVASKVSVSFISIRVTKQKQKKIYLKVCVLQNSLHIKPN